MSPGTYAVVSWLFLFGLKLKRTHQPEQTRIDIQMYIDIECLSNPTSICGSTDARCVLVPFNLWINDCKVCTCTFYLRNNGWKVCTCTFYVRISGCKVCILPCTCGSMIVKNVLVPSICVSIVYLYLVYVDQFVLVPYICGSVVVR